MDNEALGARRRRGVYECQQMVVALLMVNAQAVLHGDRQAAAGGHGLDAAGHVVGLRHQAGAKTSRLDPFTGTAQVQVEFVVAPHLRHARRFRQQQGIVTPHLERQGMFNGVVVQQALLVAVVERLGHHHFRVQQGLTADLAHQHPKMPIRAVQHRRHAEGVPFQSGRSMTTAGDGWHGTGWGP